MKDCFLLGYHGLGNIGDDLMAKSFLIEKKSFYNKIYTGKLLYPFQGVKSLNGLRKLIYMFLADDLVTTGGNIFSYERKKSIFKIIFIYMLFLFRKKIGKTNIIDSIGLDLEIDKRLRKIIIKTFLLADHISLRDNFSYRYLRYCFFYLKIEKNITMQPDRVIRSKTALLKQYNTYLKCSEKEFFIWFISQPAAKKNKYSLQITKDFIINNNIFKKTQKGILFCQGNEDILRANQIRQILEPNIKCDIINYSCNEDIENLLSILPCSKFVVTERYHGALLAEIYEKSWYKLPFTEKLDRVSPSIFLKSN
ncbi:polysaccharide pyruvyl transferase family protein [Hydrogenimonas cancrithermarum]|uniref:Polysaccharide pyruvyl transferase domain-containing protein n=1 Tax=Hydrogenimonas cancrithermarum TaxID=2993563 RepID=A0ABM8FM21_9BACT|nr:polysaccharide pyruvyl transferase family protein [Hydrogenimonas cancrithermarum]BDY13416.1 hypothetical protein HCR_17280 [Hydrogenimonas cancrithermarum]